MSPHILHAACTEEDRQNKISRLVGHEYIRMTQRYSYHGTKSLRDEVGILILTTIGQI